MRVSILTFALAAGAALLAQPQATKPQVPTLPTPGPGLKEVQPARRLPIMPTAVDISRLRALVEAAEKALAADDEVAAGDRCDEAEILIADWSEDALRLPEVAPLLERLEVVSTQVAVDGEEADETTPGRVEASEAQGLKVSDEVVSLSGEDLRAEMARVRAAEEGVVYDFPIDLNEQVVTWVNIFSGRLKAKIEGGLSRGSRYLPMIRQVFQEEGVPLDLAFLPLIESGYINHAKSYASAVGMWQFMRPTGRIFGLNGNAWVEERRDPVKSTRAAARYLKRLYQISGDWYLALVGYNAGPLTTERAIAGLGTRNFWDMSRSRFLRTQTKNYVPEMCAAVLVGRHPERYGLTIPQQAPYVYETVEVGSMTSLSVLARFAGTDVDALKDLNPELLRGSTPPGRYTLRVPPGTSGAVNRALARIPAGQRLDFQTYVVRKGDTLAKVAARFKVGPADLLASNDMTAAQFKPGRQIKVPPPSSTAIDQRDLLPAEERRKILGERPLEPLPMLPREEAAITPGPAGAGEAPKTQERIPSPDNGKAAPAVPRKAVFYVVKAGDTLFAIARSHGVTVENLKHWNQLRGNAVRKGQKLRVSAP